MHSQTNKTPLFYFFLFIWAFAINTSESGSTYLIAVSALGLYTIFYIAKYKQYPALKEVFIKLKYIVLSIVLISITMTISNSINYSLTYPYSWYSEFAFIYCYLVGIFALMFFYHKQLFSERTLLTLIIFVLVASAIFFFLQRLFDISIHSHGIWWDWGFSNNKNKLGGLMSLAFLICMLYKLKYFPTLSRLNNNILNLLMLIFIVCILLTAEKASWISLMLSLFIYLILRMKTIKIKHIVSILLGIIAFCGVAFVLYKHNYITLYSYDTSSAPRLEMWKCGINYFLQNPAFGNGLTWKSYNCSLNLPFMHNSTIETLFSFGLIGALAIAMFFLIHIYKAIKSKNIEWLVILLFFLIYSQFDHSLYYWQYFYPWMLIISFFILSRKNFQQGDTLICQN